MTEGVIKQWQKLLEEPGTDEASNLQGVVPFATRFNRLGTYSAFTFQTFGELPDFLAGLPTGASAPTLPRAEIDLLARQLAELRRAMTAMSQELAELRAELERRPLVYSTQLFDLDAAGLKTLVPIPVVLEETDEEALARWPEVRASGLGATLSEAVSNLKAEIAELFFDLTGRAPDTLGPEAQAMVRALQRHLAGE